MVQTGAAHVRARGSVPEFFYFPLFLFARSSSASDPRCGVLEVVVYSLALAVCGVLYGVEVTMAFRGLVQGSNLFEIQSNY